jgi:hypothetical protein
MGELNKTQKAVKDKAEAYKSGFDFLNNIKLPSGIEPDNLKLIKVKGIDKDNLELDNRVFMPTWENKPIPKESLLSINGTQLLTYQNIGVFVADQGTGKTSVCESICSAIINQDQCDTLGFKVSKEIKRVLFIDMERTQTDVWNSYYRMNKRAGLKVGDVQDKAIILGLRLITNLKERKETIIQLMESHKPDIVIFDGSGDLVEDTNANIESKELTIWLRHLTNDFGCSIITTLHPNKGTMNVRGHVGGELLREAEFVMFITKKGDVHKLSTNHAQGKNRNASSTKAEGSFTWSDEVNMFVNCHSEPNSIGRPKVKELEDMEDEDIFALLHESHASLEYSYSYSATRIRNSILKLFPDQNCNLGAVKKFISFLVDNEYLIKKKEGRNTYYFVNKFETESEQHTK